MRGLILILAGGLVIGASQQPIPAAPTPSVQAPSLFAAQDTLPDPDPEAYPGQSQHAQPPEGWFCEHPTPETLETMDPAHICNCERSCDESGTVREDNMRCSVACHPDSCKCPVSNVNACK